ncbi:heavy metal translocating P-type ATPase [Desulfosporosinus sp. FKA]|uniref:heavy metal translocating P-type ATPase n=1 Tax=Desulfosporosinus sp. FKA TaxID=1969834 RepID=UPI000B49A103|nr:heavy metal translocating P-type ATPase [Desulfosporosinus sp. FKA]
MAQVQSSEIKVLGMSCEHCVRRVTKALEDLPGIENVEVTLDQAKANFNWDPSVIDRAAIRRAIEEADYNVDDSEYRTDSKAEFNFDTNQVEDGDIRGAIEEAGYSVTPVQEELKDENHNEEQNSTVTIESSSPITQKDTHEQIQLKVTGMTCANCALTIEKGVAKMSGIKRASVNFASEKLAIEYDPSLVKTEDVLAKVKDLGYGAYSEGMEDGKKQFKVSGMSCANCALTIEKKLKNTPGVSSVSVNFAAETVNVEYNPSVINLEAIYEKVRDAGYTPIENNEESLEDQAVKKQLYWLIVSAILSAPIVPLMYMQMSQTSIYIMFVLATIVQFTAGWTFYRGAYHALKNRSPNMDVLVALGTTAAYAYSAMTTFPQIFFNGPNFFDTSALLIVFVRFGKYLEAKAKGRAGQALKRLLELQADKARIIVDDQEKEVPASSVKIGDIVVIKPGEKIPIDGEIIEGQASIDEAMITGESIPVDKGIGDPVVGATINSSGIIKVKTTKTGKDTMLSGIIKMVEDAQGVKPEIQRLADTISNYFVPTVVTIALITFSIWYFLIHSGFVFALTAGIAVLVVACPCALGLATPTAVMVGSGVGLNRGILFKSAAVLEAISKLEAIGFDKTGTLTKGRPEVTDIVSFNGYTDKEVLTIAAAGENPSIHPLAQAVVGRAKDDNVTIEDVENYQEKSGHGIVCLYQGKQLLIGNIKLIQKYHANLGSSELDFQRLAEEGKTTSFVAIDGEVIGLIALADVLKESTKEAIARLHHLGIKTFMITGDNKKVANVVGSQVGIDEVIAEVLPQDKINIVKKFQDQGLKVAMVGDGINDAPALAQADIGIAVGSGTDVAKETGDVVLVRNDLLDVERAIRLGRKTLGKIKQNLFWALIYNTVGIPIAAGMLYPVTGKLLPPEWAGLAMAFSSVSVVTSSLLLKKYDQKLAA